MTDSPVPARSKASINRQDLLDAAMRLLGPNRSVSTLGLREVARAADIAPNSFYRHFRDIDELAVALIDQAGDALRSVVREARIRANEDRNHSAVSSSVATFMEQLNARENYLHLLLREGNAGSTAFKESIERQLQYFEDELTTDLIRLTNQAGRPLFRPELVSKGITRLIFALGARAMDQPERSRKKTAQHMMIIIRMMIEGAHKSHPDQ